MKRSLEIDIVPIGAGYAVRIIRTIRYIFSKPEINVSFRATSGDYEFDKAEHVVNLCVFDTKKKAVAAKDLFLALYKEAIEAGARE